MIPIRSERSSSLLLALLLAADVALIALFVLQGFGWVVDEGLQLTRDRSYGEVYQYVKQFWTVLLLATMAWSSRRLFFAIVAVLFTYFLIDDYAELHETMGELLAEQFARPILWGIDTYHFGEFAVFCLYGILGLGLVIATFPKPQDPQRSFARDLVGLLALMALFAVGIDAVHALPWPELVGDAIGGIEDGGEMVVMSFIVWRIFDEAMRTAPVVRRDHVE
ncbi:MAG: hypothetical protein ACR2NU_17215 [Aeoliella sp.]